MTSNLQVKVNSHACPCKPKCPTNNRPPSRQSPRLGSHKSVRFNEAVQKCGNPLKDCVVVEGEKHDDKFLCCPLGSKPLKTCLRPGSSKKHDDCIVIFTKSDEKKKSRPSSAFESGCKKDESKKCKFDVFSSARPLSYCCQRLETPFFKKLEKECDKFSHKEESKKDCHKIHEKHKDTSCHSIKHKNSDECFSIYYDYDEKKKHHKHSTHDFKKHKSHCTELKPLSCKLEIRPQDKPPYICNYNCKPEKHGDNCVYFCTPVKKKSKSLSSSSDSSRSSVLSNEDDKRKHKEKSTKPKRNTHHSKKSTENVEPQKLHITKHGTIKCGGTKYVKSVEIIGSVVHRGCKCEKRDGLQDLCPKYFCRKHPECIAHIK